MSPSTITLLFLAFAIVSFILEKIPLGLTATIVAIGLNLTGVLSNSDAIVGALGSNPNPMVLLIVIFVVGCALTNFMSNTATTALMRPIGVAVNVGCWSHRNERKEKAKQAIYPEVKFIK